MPTTASAAPARPAAAPVLYLIGEDWVGRWQDDRVVARATLTGQRIETAVADHEPGLTVLSFPAAADGGATLLRYPATGGQRPAPNDVAELWPGNGATLLAIRTGPTTSQAIRFDPRSFAMAGLAHSVATTTVRPRVRAGRWLVPLPLLVGIDDEDGGVVAPAELIDAATLAVAARPAWLMPGRALLAIAGNTALVMDAPRRVTTVAIDSGRALASRTIAAETPDRLRAMLSPDGGTAALFVAGGDAGRWPGIAWDVATGRGLPFADFAIDSGSTRESGAPRSLACLLPHGAGAIFSTVGAPADRASDAVVGVGRNSRRVVIAGAYVQRCVIAPPR